MDFYLSLTVVSLLLEREQRLSYRFLRHQFAFDEDTLENLKHELVVKRLAVDEDGEGLLWTGGNVRGPAVGIESKLGGPTGSAVDVKPSISTSSPEADLSAPILPIVKSDAERRHLTVMFCDLAGSTALSTQLDPEDLREVITSYQDACRESIARYDGFIARYMGDGMLVYFGYPRAHENDAERAVRAGLDILAAMPSVNTTVGTRYSVDLAVRVGIATGPVVVGDIIGEGAAEEAAVIGETPNLAARLEGVAAQGELAISQGTYRLVEGLFEFADLGRHALKGIAEPTQVWRVVSERNEDAASHRPADATATPLVGRQEELGLLRRAWEGAREGRGQVVLMQGEAGLGKSRLLDTLRDSIADEPHTWVAIRSSPYHTATSLYPVTEQLKRALGWAPEDSDAERLAKLERLLDEQTDFRPGEIVPLFATLLALDLPEGRYAPQTISPQARRESTLDALSTWLLDLTDRAPVLLAWEDLHWADPTTVELLSLMLDQVPTASILMVGTFRPDFVPPWPGRAHVTPITLARLGAAEVGALASALADEKALPDVVLERLIDKADGVPLYVEELTKAILASNALVDDGTQWLLEGPLDEFDIPETLQDSLMSRLDRIPLMREMAQIGAVVGREFAYQMVRSLAAHEEGLIHDGLAQLVANELVYQRGRGERARYMFKHALIQDAAYQSLLRRTRQTYHAQVAQLLESEFPDAARSQPEVVAHHYSGAGDEYAERASLYWEQAADTALARGANLEAASHLQSALESLGKAEESIARHERELALQTKIGPPIIFTRGYADPLVQSCYARAEALCEVLGDRTKLAFIVRGQQLSELIAGDIEVARSMAERVIEITEGSDDPGVRAGGFQACMQSDMLAGRLDEALAHADRGIELWELATGEVENWPGAQPGPICHLNRGHTCWLRGDPDAGLKSVENAVALQRASGQPFRLGSLLSSAAMVPAWRGDYATARSWAQEAVEICETHSIDYWWHLAKGLLDWVDVKETATTGAVDALEQTAVSFLSRGWRAYSNLLSTLLTDSCLIIGDISRGQATVERELQFMEQSREHWLEAELHRLQGELAYAESPTDIEAAGESIRRAIEVARMQNARSLELRALMSQFRLYRGNCAEVDVGEQLATCYGAFAEGLDTADLRAARTLLESSLNAAGASERRT